MQHHSCTLENIDRRLEEIQRAVPATHDLAVITAGVATALAVVRLLRELRQSIHSYDGQIEKLARVHPDFEIFDSLPGAGAALVPRLIAAFGTQRDRYHSARELQCYSGIAPVVASSGKQSWVHWRWACPTFLRQTFHEWALHTIASSSWAKAYYDQQRAKGKTRNTAVRALAFKWIRVLFRCWKNRTPYQEHLYLEALAKRSVCKQEPVNLQWKTCGGFSKFSSFIP